MTQPTDHLSDQQLREFASGQAPHDVRRGIVAHLAVCEECSRRVALYEDRQDPATDVTRLRRAPIGEGLNSTHALGTSYEDTLRQKFLPALAPGATLGHYTIGAAIGKGAFGTVFRGRDNHLNRDVAIKVLHHEASGAGVRRFFREARAAGRLRHKNICPVYDIGSENGRHYIVMGLVEGETLRDYLDAGKTVKQKQAVHAIYKLASALHEAHSQGIVHRDLKPANIMVDIRRRELVILDFGLAQHLDGRSSRMTQTGDVLGTPVYMAPEQVRGDVRAVGPQSDVYALGVILYELLAGRRPFQGSVAEVFAKILYESPVPPSSHSKEVPLGLDAICLRALEKDLNRRYESMQALRDALVDFSQGKSAPAALDFAHFADQSQVDWSPPDLKRVPVEDDSPPLMLATATESALGTNDACPECGAVLATGTMLCDECGYHQGLRRKFSAFSELEDGMEEAPPRGWISSQLTDGDSAESFALAAWLVAPIAGLFVLIWIAAKFGLWYALCGAVFLAALLIAVLNATRVSMDPNLAWLSLYRARGWRQLVPMRFRKVLDLRGVATSDEDLRSLNQEWNIEVLDLEGAAITDVAIDHLARLTTLRYVVLRGTGISQAGLAELRERLPNARFWT